MVEVYKPETEVELFIKKFCVCDPKDKESQD